MQPWFYPVVKYCFNAFCFTRFIFVNSVIISSIISCNDLYQDFIIMYIWYFVSRNSISVLGAIWPSLSPCTVINLILLTYLPTWIILFSTFVSSCTCVFTLDNISMWRFFFLSATSFENLPTLSLISSHNAILRECISSRMTSFTLDSSCENSSEPVSHSSPSSSTRCSKCINSGISSSRSVMLTIHHS